MRATAEVSTYDEPRSKIKQVFIAEEPTRNGTALVLRDQYGSVLLGVEVGKDGQFYLTAKVESLADMSEHHLLGNKIIPTNGLLSWSGV